jgi:hypothetical protein
MRAVWGAFDSLCELKAPRSVGRSGTGRRRSPARSRSSPGRDRGYTLTLALPVGPRLRGWTRATGTDAFNEFLECGRRDSNPHGLRPRGPKPGPSPAHSLRSAPHRDFRPRVRTIWTGRTTWTFSNLFSRTDPRPSDCLGSPITVCPRHRRAAARHRRSNRNRTAQRQGAEAPAACHERQHDADPRKRLSHVPGRRDAASRSLVPALARRPAARAPSSRRATPLMSWSACRWRCAAGSVLSAGPLETAGCRAPALDRMERPGSPGAR